MMAGAPPSRAARAKKERLDAIFAQCKEEILGPSFHPAAHEATRLAAYLMQLDLGDYDAATTRMLPTEDVMRYLAPSYIATKPKPQDKEVSRRLVVAEWETLAGTSPLQAKLRLAKICRASPTFGAILCPCKHGGGKRAKGALVGPSSRELLVIDAVTKDVLEKHPLDKICKWQATEEALVVGFRDYDFAQIAVRIDAMYAADLSGALAVAVKRLHRRRRSKRRRRTSSSSSLADDDVMSQHSPTRVSRSVDSVISEDVAMETASMTSTNMGGGGGSGSLYGGSTYAGSSINGGSMGKQAGFLQGFNRSSTSSWGLGSLDMNKGSLARLSKESAATSDGGGGRGGVGMSNEDNEPTDAFTAFLDDASDDITASAETLDSVARLGPNRANARWCEKIRAVGKVHVKRVVLGISVKCKELIPIAELTARSNPNARQRREARDLATSTVSLFVSTLPPLSGQVVRLAALSTLRGRGEELLDAAGDMWVGILQLVQGMRYASDTDLHEAFPMVAGGAQRLLKLLPVLTPEDEYKRDNATRKGKGQYEAPDPKIAEALREVSRLAKEEESRKQKEETKRKADLKRAVAEADKEAARQTAKAEAAAQRRAREEARRQEEEARRQSFQESLQKWEHMTGGVDTITI